MTTTQLYLGESIRNSKMDILKEINPLTLYLRISSPDENLLDLVNKLRLMRTIDRQKYNEMKLRLPYFIPSSFNENIRNSLNFKGAHGFVLDLDDLPSHGLNPEVVFVNLTKDPRVALLFRSPGGYGIKALFMFSETITNTMIFSSFYKAFSILFSKQYQLEKVMDLVTSDATRICFLSADYHAYFNENWLPVNPNDYLPELISGIESDSLFSEPSNAIINSGNVNCKSSLDVDEKGLSTDVMKEISIMLSPAPHVIKRPKQHYVPPQLEGIEAILHPILEANGISLDSSTPIQYGKQIRFSQVGSFSEHNIFYGKNGFSIVTTTRKGYCSSLAKKMNHLIATALFQ